MRYRADIDGLRAVAVLTVLLFHAGFTSFSGGYIGVDVFFVISGFLITRLIRDQVVAGSFKFSEFYIRRMRRLFPALFFTLFVSFIISFTIFSPQDFGRFSGALVYAIFSVSNFYFWRESGYFDAGADVKPLLHTWSLSVEEQFYLVWPVMLFLLLRLRRRWITPAVIVWGSVFSLYLNDVFSDGFTRFFGTMFANGPSTIYFLAPFRVFEFGFGAILVWLIRYQPKNRQLLEPLVPIGLAMIAYCLFTYTQSTIFPSYNALLPCLGTALIIYGGTSRYTSRILDNPPMVGLGLISYSLYLVHWPMVVFYKYYKFENLELIDMYAICGLSIGAAILMHRFIEKPFRYGRIGGVAVGKAAYASVCVVLASLVAGPAMAAWLNTGWAWRFPGPVAEKLLVPIQNFRDFNTVNSEPLRRSDFAENGRPKILVIGDSQGSDFINLLHEAGLGQAFDLRFHSISGDCQPLYGIPRAEFIRKIAEDARAPCMKHLGRLNADRRVVKADTIILAAAWKYWSALLVPRVAKSLKDAGVKNVIVVGPKTQGWSGLHLLMREYVRKKNDTRKFALRQLPEESLSINRLLKSNSSNYVFLDMYNTICSRSSGCDYITNNKEIIFFDRLHLTPDGTAYLSAKLARNGFFQPLTGLSPALWGQQSLDRSIQRAWP